MSATSSPHPRRLGRSIGAVLLGFVAVVVLSLGTDQVMHSLGVFPGWGKPIRGAGLFLLALAYRTAYGVAGSYVAARFAPNAPMRHALAVGVIGTVLGVMGVIAAMGNEEMGPRRVARRRALPPAARGPMNKDEVLAWLRRTGTRRSA